MHADVTIHSLTFEKTIDVWDLAFGCYATTQQTVNKQTNLRHRFLMAYTLLLFL